MKKRLLAMLLVGAMTISTIALVGCGNDEAAPAEEPVVEEPEVEEPEVEEPEVEEPAEEPAVEVGGFVGVSMPTQDLQRWNQDGENMQAELLAAGFEVDLQFAGNDVAVQIAQLEGMIAAGVDVLVIAAIDGFSLGPVLELAQDEGIYVIAYDRLIMGTDAVSYYATFDNFLVGEMQGQFIVDSLDLENAEGPYNIEIFTGDPGDNNAVFFFGGGMSRVQPFIDSGVLVVQSGQVEFDQVATADWSTANAQSRMEALIAAHFADGTPLHAVLCSNDSTALGVVNALLALYDGDVWPYITGQDCDIVNMQNMIAGYQQMNIFKDTRALAAQTVVMIQALLSGQTVPVNNTTDYHNDVFYVPTYLLPPIVVTIDNFREILIDSGYYTEADLGL
jgi:putative multiple sugar transport system substrate-binding protein